MAKILVLAEKPSVGRDIARVLGCKNEKNGYIEGNKYIVTWALGHLVTLADPETYDKKYKSWDMSDLPILPKDLKTVVIKKSAKQFNTVKAQLNRNDVNEVVIATDAGREGELVARWIIEKAHIKKPIKRLWISSSTDKAIKEGFTKLKDAKEYNNLYYSAIARAEADWIVGINATRALTTKYNASLSCGRVQTPTLAMILKREDEIRNFKPKDYYTLDILTEKGGNYLKLSWHDKNNSTSTFNKEKIENIGYSLYDVEYAKEGPNYYLRIYIDKPDGIDLNDCEKVNDEINDLLDQADYIKDQYFLEVSSPGIERILKKDSHLEQNIGNQVEAKLYKKDENGRKSYIGELKAFDADTITIDEIKFDRKNIAQLKTIYNWEN